ncbi:MAG TPA: 2-C-methyl-D-erythritol 4-phosphate cytidylyltransferase [Steroidobacteraceae bacterium]|nr:2-C-methyl-D-erythritol 4-phosphate cytidylyltransferase [Steroidobacteraceae bacterium]
MAATRYWIVMPAAGVGRRFGGSKQYALLGDRTVLETALQPFLDDPQCRGGSLLLAADDPHRGRLTAGLPPQLTVDDGGSERAHSVCNGLRALEARAAADDWVLVHDAARPALSAADLQRLLQYGALDAVGALLAAPVADTVKRAQGGNGPIGVRRCDATLPREGLWLAQTPQMFRYAPLRAALERAVADGRTPTDEAQAMEWQGHAALLVQAQDSNIKITTATDLLLAQAILRQRAVQ